MGPLETKEAMALRLKVLTYNIRHGRLPSGRDAFRDLVRFLADSEANLIGLQEVDSRRVRSRLRSQSRIISRALDFHSAYAPALGGVRWRGYGNALVSRFPLEYVDQVFLPNPSGEPRVCLVAGIRIEEMTVSCMVTHLSPQREAIAQQVPRLMEISSSLPFPKLLIGDLNVHPEDPLIGLLLEEFHTFSLEPTFPAESPVKKIDYILFSKEFRPIRGGVIEVELSDHLPLYVELEIAGEAPSPAGAGGSAIGS